MTTETPSVDEARQSLWAAYYQVQAAAQSPGTPAPDMLRAIATFEAALIRERDEAIALLRRYRRALDAEWDHGQITGTWGGNYLGAEVAVERFLARFPEGGEG